MSHDDVLQGGKEILMRASILRAIPPLFLVGGGIASVIYGAMYHTSPVSVEQEIEIPIAPPPMPGFPGEPPLEEPFGGPSFGGPPGMMPPPPFLEKVKEIIIVTEEESEFTLIREVTFGGVKLLASGDIMRTYTGEPPSLCPT
jgi:hypothetical protein